VLRHLTFRSVASSFCGACALVFLTINSIILARGAGRWAVSEWDRVSYMIVAATVPWVIALMPFLLAVTFRRGRRLTWPTVWTWVIAGVWVVFVAYNILGAGGAMNFIRTDVLSTRKDSAVRARDLTAEREQLVALRAAIPKETRPGRLLRPLLEAEQAKPMWDATEGCREPGSASARKFCGAYAKLASEMGAAEEIDRLTAAIAVLDKQSAAVGTVSEVVDPAAQFWAAWTGMSLERVQAVIPLATPIVLELGSMVFLSFALLLAGFQGHRQVVLGGQNAPLPRPLAAETGGAVAAGPTALAPAALPPPRHSEDPVTRGKELAAWFFAECTRPVASGGLPEQRWYALYEEQCAKSNSTPIDLDEFRALANAHGAVPVLIDGVWIYKLVLPHVPREGAA
jgi:hypothetical protein